MNVPVEYYILVPNTSYQPVPYELPARMPHTIPTASKQSDNKANAGMICSRPALFNIVCVFES
jgi:hypothetical protein